MRVRAGLFTCLPQDTGTVRTLPVGFLCGLRLTKRLLLGDEDGFLKTTDIRCFAVRDKQTYSNTFACPRELCDAL